MLLLQRFKMLSVPQCDGMVLCDGVYKPLMGQEGIKEQFWAKEVPNFCLDTGEQQYPMTGTRAESLEVAIPRDGQQLAGTQIAAGSDAGKLT